jgi:DNA polymerase (family 10)
MPVANLAVAAALEEIADRLEIQEANPFRVRAYRNAARTVQSLGRDVQEMAARGETLEGTPGIGSDLAHKIAEIATRGSCAMLDRLRGEMPAAITELLQVPGLGPKRVRALWHELDVETPEQVLRAARDGRIRALHGFGEKMERGIENALAAHLTKERRVKLAVAAEYAQSMVRHLEGVRGLDRVVVAGSFRRMRETVGDLDILATGSASAKIVQRFLEHPEVAEVRSRGTTRAGVRLRGGLGVDLRVVPTGSFGAALAYFTGSKAHNIALRRLAQERGLKINEYGVFRGDLRIAGDTEESVYAAVGLPWIAPELREDRGELDAARAGTLPRLIELADLRGDLHVHTDATDGRDGLEAMAAAARAQGLSYVAITEHSRRQAMAHGLDAARLAQQVAAIERLNARTKGFRVLTGIEVDILEDGSLDLPDAAIAGLDVVVAAVHSQFGLTRARQTGRILRALDNPHVRLLAHPTGRLIDEREPYDIDMPAVVRKARERGIALELNAHPERLDLIDTHCRMCRDAGVPVAINSDAHATGDFAYLRYGIGQARRGWLGRDDVLNTRALPALLAFLERAVPAGRRSRAHAGRGS